MDKSFVIIPKEHSIEFSDSPSSCSMIINKIVTINSICDGVNKLYMTDYPNVVKLCRFCITDICKELTDRANFETKRYKGYNTARDNLIDCIYYPDDEKNGILEELYIEATDAKYRYTQYYALLAELRGKALYTKACIICTEILH